MYPIVLLELDNVLFLALTKHKQVDTLMCKYYLKYLLLIVFCIGTAIPNSFGLHLDEIKKAIIYQTDSASYLILHELYYHPVNSSFEKGSVRSSGYSESKIKVIDIESGKIITEKNMGVMDSTSACVVLGFTKDNLWIYWTKHKSGLQSLNPVSLEKQVSQATIYSLMKGYTGQLAQPQWNEINLFYGFNEYSNQLIVTNTNEERFFINCHSYEVTKASNKIPLNPVFDTYTANSVSYKDSALNFSAQHRDYIELNANTAFKKAEFHEGSFIMKQNISQLKHYYQQKLIDLSDKANSETQILAVNANLNALKNNRKPDKVILQANADYLLVLHKSDQSNEATIQVSKVKLENWESIKKFWTTPLYGMFWNVSRARNSEYYKKLFPNFEPESEFKYINYVDNKLIVVYLLQVYCIDINTGEALWRKKL